MSDINELNQSQDLSISKPKSRFEKALQSWTEVNLPQLQQQLDLKALEIEDFQNKTLESRKNLATNTKDFKKLNDELKLNQFKTLLKQYQNEIDTLTNRSKLSESSFFEIYKSIAELPDPKPLLEASLDSVIISQEVESLQQNNNSLKLELLKFKDYDSLKAKLLRLEQKSVETLENRLKLKEEELFAIFEEKENNWNDEKFQYLNKIEDLELKYKDLLTQSKIDKIKLQNHRLTLDEDEIEEEEEILIDEKSVENITQIDQLNQDLKSQKSITDRLQKRNEELIKELSISKNLNKSNEIKFVKELKLNELESENSLLVSKFDQLKLNTDLIVKNNQSTINSLQNDVKDYQLEIDQLNKKLVKYKDYEDIKQELNTLRQISFGFDNDDDDQDEEEAEAEEESIKIQENLNSNDDTNSKLDEILITRNKKLTDEIVQYRIKNEELNNNLIKSSQDLKKSNEEISKLQKLNNKLESDLLQYANNNNNKFSDSTSMLSGISKFTKITTNTRNSPNGSIIGLSDFNNNNNVDDSVLPIITSQRDRFRSRNLELETQLQSQNNQINDLQNQIKRLNQDNQQLFGKIRYLQSIPSKNYQNNNIKINDLEKNYESNYEDSLNPLTKFKLREQERISSKLSPLERIFLSFAKAILANKTSRLLFLGYCCGLHCIVMLMTWYVMSLQGSLTPDVGMMNKQGGGVIGNHN
ncbi:hypothetical protein WICMUC_000201 [Wickerhamomyces mucosus]|uniref:Protein CASP n=1 Tax=Wickerhamomyces mucosus TaxID=1378264 RepID=A0A9P8TJ25_9ASCO|nr:hypothetical protein WICMUC_000201 [Wickerhamomyces mucosus]